MRESIHTLVQRREEILARLDDMTVDVDTIMHQVGARAATEEPAGIRDGHRETGNSAPVR